jgi:hypothetical protein
MMPARPINPPDTGFSATPAQACSDNARWTTCFYMNEIPPFVGAELERLYGSIYASISQFRIYDQDGPVSTYVAGFDNCPVAVLLFRIDGERLLVLNQVIQLEIAEINRFAQFAFTSFPTTKVILFRALHTGPEKLDYFCLRHNCLEDIVLTLPATVPAYFSSLGKNTRRNLKRYQRKLLDAHPGFRFEILDTVNISQQVMRDIVALNRARMAGKKKASTIDTEKIDALIAHAHDCGLVGVATMDGRVCAGAISFRSDRNYFLSVIAHDPRYDEYWLGILCCYMTICECIARSGREFHFLWGEYDYKYTLQGVRRDLDNLALYRSPVQMLWHADVALNMARGALARHMHLWLHTMSHSERPLYRWIKQAVQRWR